MLKNWHFRKSPPGAMHCNPTQGEFFIETNIVDRIVRETLQNSLDAKSETNEAARVCFSLGEAEFPQPKWAFYFEELLPHLQANQWPFIPAPGKFSYLVIEDFNTTGLVGDPRQDYDNDKNDFYYFFRNIGRTGKGGDKGGSWGIGKWVFPNASKINAFFALTHRADHKTLFMGQAILKQHTIDETQYDFYGFFSRLEGDPRGEVTDGDWQPKIDEKLQIPFDNEQHADVIRNFKTDFNLHRNNETGLSIVIPFVNEHEDDEQTETTKLSVDNITRSVIKCYFYPIVTGELSVAVKDNEHHQILDQDTIERVISDLEWPEHHELNSNDLKYLIEMARENIKMHKIDGWQALKNAKISAHIDIRLGDEKESIAHRYNNNERLYLKIPVPVHERKKDKEISYFTAIVQKDDNVQSGKDYYVRGNLAIEKIDTVKKYPTRVFVHIDKSEPLANLLRLAEDPSHQNWHNASERAKEKFTNSFHTVQLVKSAVRDILASISTDNELVNKDLFKDIFFITKKKSKPTTGNKSNQIEDIPTNPELFTADSVQGGVVISATDIASQNMQLPEVLEINLAYVCNGNPLTKYNSYDFQLDQSPIQIEYENCIYQVDKNNMRVSNIDKNTKIKITGFDENRDLFVKIEPAKQSTDDEVHND